MKCVFCEESFEDFSLGMHTCKLCFQEYNPYLLTHLLVDGPYGVERVNCYTHGMRFTTRPYIKAYGNMFEARIGVSFKIEDICIESPFDQDFGWQYARGKGTTPWAATLAMMKDLGRFASLAIELG